MPFIVPIICFAQYAAALKYDLQNFCFVEGDDANVLRNKFVAITSLESRNGNNAFRDLLEEIKFFDKSKQKQAQQAKNIRPEKAGQNKMANKVV